MEERSSQCAHISGTMQRGSLGTRVSPPVSPSSHAPLFLLLPPPPPFATGDHKDGTKGSPKPENTNGAKKGGRGLLAAKTPKKGPADNKKPASDKPAGSDSKPKDHGSPKPTGE